MKDCVVVTVTLNVTLGVDSGERLQEALRYVLAELEQKLGSMRGETQITAASAALKKKENASG